MLSLNDERDKDRLERLALAAYGSTTARIAFEEAVRYAKERKAFGRPIVGFQVTRHKLADMATRVTAAETLVYQVAHRMEAGEYCVKEVSMAKLKAGRLAREVADTCLQFHGGMGYVEEYPIARYFRDSRLLSIGAGADFDQIRCWFIRPFPWPLNRIIQDGCLLSNLCWPRTYGILDLRLNVGIGFDF